MVPTVPDSKLTTERPFVRDPDRRTSSRRLLRSRLGGNRTTLVATQSRLLELTAPERSARPVSGSEDLLLPSDGDAGRPPRSPGSILMTAAVVTAGMGLLVVAFAFYLFGFTSIEAFHSQHRLAEQLAGSAGLAALNGRTPPVGQAVAILAIPAIGIRQVVLEGTTSKDLESGPGLLIGSAPPGTAGNVVIAGRRTTFGSTFARIDTLQRGDPIVVTGALGKFSYVVTATRIVSPGSPLPAGPTTAGRLTLVTSTPAVRATSLLIVTADLVGKPVAYVPLKAAGLPPAQFGLAGDGAATVPAILWGAALVAVLLGSWYLLRRSGKTWLVYGLATPVVIATALLCFASVAALLPATL
jgi:LPXTG-site transpeptidase (sortase) family protein